MRASVRIVSAQSGQFLVGRALPAGSSGTSGGRRSWRRRNGWRRGRRSRGRKDGGCALEHRRGRRPGSVRCAGSGYRCWRRLGLRVLDYLRLPPHARLVREDDVVGPPGFTECGIDRGVFVVAPGSLHDAEARALVFLHLVVRHLGDGALGRGRLEPKPVARPASCATEAASGVRRGPTSCRDARGGRVQDRGDHTWPCTR